jgi:HTH-type transcriptional regulator/antitoxin MqsA
MKCPNCGAAELVHDTRDLYHTYEGEATVIPLVTGDFCPACGEGVFAMDEAGRISNFMLGFDKKVNASIVDPGFIASVRKKLDLDQQEAAEIFGSGANAFSRYETGEVKPPVALVKLFKLVERHPELWAEVRAV